MPWGVSQVYSYPCPILPLSSFLSIEAVNNQIKLLMITQESPKGYVDIVSSTRMEGEEIDEEMGEHQRWIVQQKIIVHTLALIQAKDKMESLKNWDACWLRVRCEQGKTIRNEDCKMLMYR